MRRRISVNKILSSNHTFLIKEEFKKEIENSN
jgi:hypothetical protein